MGVSYSAAQVREQDIDRFHLAMMFPREIQEACLALAAFNLEISRTASRVSDANLGLIRLQWWREVLQEIKTGEQVRAHQVARDLKAAGGGVDFVSLRGIIEAHEHDLQDVPFGDVEDVRVYVLKTSGALLRAQARMLHHDNTDAIANHLGCAFGFIGLARTMVAGGPVQFTRLPQTWIEDPVAGVHEAAGQAVMHLDRAQELRADIPRPRALSPLFATAVLVRAWQARIQGVETLGQAQFARPLPFQALRLALSRP